MENIMNKIKMTGIAMLLSLGVSGSVMAQDGFVPLDDKEVVKPNEKLQTFVDAAQNRFKGIGGICALLAIPDPTDPKKEKMLFKYDLAALVPPGYDVGEWDAPCPAQQ